MLPSEEREFEAKMEKALRSHKELLPGRNFLFNTMRYHDGDVRRKYHMGCAGPPERASLAHVRRVRHR
jgi:hypothetical protein